MFYRGSFFIRFLLVLGILAVLAFGGYLIFQAGQAQGYALGQAASGEAANPPAFPYRGYYPYLTPYHGFFFPPFFGFLCIGGLLFFFFIAVGRWFRPHHWHTHPHGPYDHWHGWEEGKHAEKSQQPEESEPSQPGEGAETQ